MKLDVSCMKYMSKEEYRVLTAVEMGMKNHELVPVELIGSIAKLKHGGSQRILSSLLRYKLIAHDQAKYNGYRLTYQGYDILALRALIARGKVTAVGNQIGVGKESDIFSAQDAEGNNVVLKFHRLGRTSFRSVKSKRDYLKHRKTTNWLYLSRLAATKEYAFMRALYANDFPTPVPLDQNRHVVLMSLVPNASPMSQLRSGAIDEPQGIFNECVRLCVKLAEHGLVHCDFNEFNLMLGFDNDDVTLIDFPQMISTMHPNAKELFERDIQCLVKFFAMKQHYIPDESEIPSFEDIVVVAGRLDEDLQASGYGNSREENQDLHRYFEGNRGSNAGDDENAEDSQSSEDEDEEELDAEVNAENEENSADSEDVGNDNADDVSDEDKEETPMSRRDSKRLDDATIIRRFRTRMEANVTDEAIGDTSEELDAEEQDATSDNESTYTAAAGVSTSKTAVRSKVQRSVRQQPHRKASRNTTKQRDKKGRIVRNTKLILDLY